MRGSVVSCRALQQESRSADARHASEAEASNTAPAAAEKECFRAVVDLREAVIQLNDSNWEKNLAVRDQVVECENAFFVPFFAQALEY